MDIRFFDEPQRLQVCCPLRPECRCKAAPWWSPPAWLEQIASYRFIVSKSSRWKKRCQDGEMVFFVWINFWVFTIGPMYQWKQLLVSHVEKCSQKSQTLFFWHPRKSSSWEVTEVWSIWPGNWLPETSPGQCDLLFPLSTHWQEHSRAGAWFNPAVYNTIFQVS